MRLPGRERLILEHVFFTIGVQNRCVRGMQVKEWR
jgi:hypothetical protein